MKQRLEQLSAAERTSYEDGIHPVLASSLPSVVLGTHKGALLAPGMGKVPAPPQTLPVSSTARSRHSIQAGLTVESNAKDIYDGTPQLPTVFAVRDMIHDAINENNSRLFRVIDAANESDCTKTKAVENEAPDGFLAHHYRSRTELLAEIQQLKKRVAEDVLFQFEKHKWKETLQQWGEMRSNLELALQRNTELELQLSEMRVEVEHQKQEAKLAHEAVKRERNLRTAVMHEKEVLAEDAERLKTQLHTMEDTMLRHENTLMAKALRNISDVAQERRDSELQEKEHWLREKIQLLYQSSIAQLEGDLHTRGLEIRLARAQQEWSDRKQLLETRLQDAETRLAEQTAIAGRLHGERNVLIAALINDVQMRHSKLRHDLSALKQCIDTRTTPGDYTDLQVEEEESSLRQEIQREQEEVRHLVMFHRVALAQLQDSVHLPPALRERLQDLETDVSTTEAEIHPAKDQLEELRWRQYEERRQFRLRQQFLQEQQAASKGKGRVKKSTVELPVPIRKGAQWPPQLPEKEFRRLWKLFKTIDSSGNGEVTLNDVRAAGSLQAGPNRVLDINTFRKIDNLKGAGVVNFLDVLREWFPDVPERQLEGLFEEDELQRMRAANKRFSQPVVRVSSTRTT